MRLLITNDDGITAPGLRALAVAASAAGHDVVVAAPHREASGSGAALSAITDQGRLILDRVEFDGLPAYSVAASPAYIAALAALGVFGPAPDILLSGINRGANAGHAVLHSGTVGAALTASNEGLRALAVSLDVLTALIAFGSGLAAFRQTEGEVRHWPTAATLAVGLLPWLSSAPPGTVLNLNVPDRPLAEVRGVRRATLAAFGQVQMAVAELGHDYARIAVEESPDARTPGTDLALLADGYATLTPLHPPAENTTLQPPES
ncbi:5'/3'-nucleotidase SurE [Dactylosporangium sp. CA-092794]|uniref:5'/3'-nucleotidase SurE n=1 Tax=Dactylosporangium sp. CA-092794 TaxID=3239929 RepID=UPI003D93795E